MAQSLRSFRHAFSVLKKQGLVKTKRSAVSVYPSQKFGGVKAETLVKKYDDVVSGKVTAVKVPKSELKKFRKAGRETAKGMVLEPHGPGEKVRFKKGTIVIEHKAGIQRVQLPIEYHNLEDWAKEIKKKHKQIDTMKSSNEYWGFRFSNAWGGGHSSEIFRDIDLMIDFIRHYEDYQKYANRPRKGAEFYRNIEIVKISKPDKWEFPSERKAKVSAEANIRHQKKWRARHHDDPEYKRKNAERERARRAAMTPAEKAKYKKASKKRSKKSRRKK